MALAKIHSPEFREKVALCNGTRRSNCFGSAAFLTGMQPEDTYVDASTFDAILGRLKRIDEPQEGSLVVWQSRSSGFPWHAGVIVSINPDIIAHREKRKGPFIENDALSVQNDFYTVDASPMYYVPYDRAIPSLSLFAALG